MPITETTHRCKICSKIYHRLDAAQKCENKGAPDANKFSIGLIYETLRAGTDEHDGGGVLMAIVGVTVAGHELELSCWSTADICMHSTDSVGHLAPMDTLNEKAHVVFQAKDSIVVINRPRQGTLRLSRLIDHLVRKGIKPLLWDGEKGVSLNPCPYEQKFSEYE